MGQFPVFLDPPPKTLEEVELQIHDVRLLGLALLVVGFTLFATGLALVVAGESGAAFIGVGGALLVPALAMLLVAPGLILAAWLRRMGHKAVFVRARA